MSVFNLHETAEESYCTIVINGEFTIPLTNTTPQVSFNVTSHLPNGREGHIPGEDAFCNWVDIIQDDDDDNESSLPTHPLVPAFTSLNTEPYPSLVPDPVNAILHRQKTKRSDKLSCPPHKGKAQISSTILLLGGYVPEANFTVKVKATAAGEDGKENRMIFNLWTEFELREKGAVVSK
ncbi:MAG: hypothetical protein M1835_002929 [Candelina submexicana]|nr:MAG: hypothetical protein M1835_002929 [Candelina submexicana]